ncbi:MULTISPECIES: peptidoglycan-associated lipoprotein Pal [unclassified Sphingomonas]|jgi:peptidoglycan-associated lipoprotein|uniref:peptidoglycan-associated lipoprotein Pal n=1 Tax=unclassified Sphingomonas TaxID=196159 RepID=UPI000E1081A3|nr:MULTISPECIES: peptidoglycan-associated lipoprotein Pal [unclassified Sphingomonas]AXJ94977.1 peptidoglycan-associated lipoprotein Pal [Sphingomonas sp. FARSPH]
MAKLSTTLMTAAAVLSLAACAHKPKQLPPPPVDNTGGLNTGNGGASPSDGTGQIGNAIVPGSDADFRRSVSSNTVHFGTDVYDIDPEARAILDSQAQWLTSHPTVRVTIEGHCDERGTREYNLALGDRRANSAKNYLVARGIDPSRLTTISYGKERPVALGSDSDAWAQNRRAVTVVVQ